jgi:hypothetical protein
VFRHRNRTQRKHFFPARDRETSGQAVCAKPGKKRGQEGFAASASVGRDGAETLRRFVALRRE